MRNKINRGLHGASGLRLLASLLFTLALTATALAQGQQQTSTEATVWRSTPATPERMSQRIEEAAVKYQSYAPVPRVVFYDIGYPRDEREYTALNGHAVILITALSQEREELPPKKVYVLMNGKEIALKRVKLVLSEQADAGSLSAKTFGAFRADALYLMPVYLRMEPADLMVDFAVGRTGLKAATFGTEVSADVRKLPIKPPNSTGPSDKTLEEFIKREFPGFFKE